MAKKVYQITLVTKTETGQSPPSFTGIYTTADNAKSIIQELYGNRSAFSFLSVVHPEILDAVAVYKGGEFDVYICLSLIKVSNYHQLNPKQRKVIDRFEKIFDTISAQKKSDMVAIPIGLLQELIRQFGRDG